MEVCERLLQGGGGAGSLAQSIESVSKSVRRVCFARLVAVGGVIFYFPLLLL